MRSGNPAICRTGQFCRNKQNNVKMVMFFFIFIKGPYADHILESPRAQLEVVHFLISNESPYFSGCKSKILALNSL